MMVIREKALIARMKDAYKGGGYTVAAMHNGKTVILCDKWAVQIDDADVPREALSLMCLHMGFLPEDGDAFAIYKGKKEPFVQRAIFEDTVKKFEDIEILFENGSERMQKTVLTYSGFNVWQRGSDNYILLVNPDVENILYKIDDVEMASNVLMTEDPVSKAYIICDNSNCPIAQRNHLSKTHWTTII